MPGYSLAGRILGVEGFPELVEPDGWGACRAPGTAALRVERAASLPIVEGLEPVWLAPTGWRAFEGRRSGERVIALEVDGRRAQVSPAAGRALLMAPDAEVLTHPLGEVLATTLLEGSAMELHASAVVGLDGRGYALAGVSGVGKTTISGLWSEMPGWRRIAEERLLLWEDGGWQAEAAPWPPGTWRAAGRMALAGVLLLGHGPRAVMRRLEPARALARILRCTFFFAGSGRSAGAAMSVAGRLIAEVPVWSLEVADTPASVAEAAAMVAGG